MSALNAGLKAHLETGLTTTCRCWALTRVDGVLLGFTDHDVDLSFEGIAFKAGSGLSALALQQSTGLSVDNTEALGALSSDVIREVDIEAGRYDGAEIRAWLVNWRDVAERQLQFRGTIGDLKRTDGAFEAELRGLTEALNRPLGRVYQKPCSAVLGDKNCKFDLTTPGFITERDIESVEERQVFRFAALPGFAENWFQFGRLVMLTGAATGLSGSIKHDRIVKNERVIELWQPLRAELLSGDRLRLEAGCDKRMETCKFKFDNLLNFQGFPDIPGDDWTITDPTKAGDLSGGSRRA